MNTGDDNWDNDFATSISPSALHLPQFKPQDNFGGLLSSDRLKAFASFDTANDENDNWDNNFEGDLITIKGPHKNVEPDSHEIETIRPYRVKPTVITQDLKPAPTAKSHSRKISTSAPPRPKSPIKSQAEAKFVLPTRPAALYREQSVDDYSDIFLDNDNVFDRRLDIVKDDALSPKLFHPSDLTTLPRSAQPPPVNGNGSMRRKTAPRREDPSMRRTRSSVEIQRYAEDEDDEDFSDIFGKDDAIVEKDESDRGSEDGVGALMLHSKLSNNSWLGDEDDDDPFASLEQGFDEMDLQANIARDKHARLCTLVEGLVSSLKVTEDPETLADLSEQLVSILPMKALEDTNYYSLTCSTNLKMQKVLSSALMACSQSLKYWSLALSKAAKA